MAWRELWETPPLAGRAEGNPTRYTAAKVNRAREKGRRRETWVAACAAAAPVVLRVVTAVGLGVLWVCEGSEWALQPMELSKGRTEQAVSFQKRALSSGSELTLGLATSMHSGTVSSDPRAI